VGVGEEEGRMGWWVRKGEEGKNRMRGEGNLPKKGGK